MTGGLFFNHSVTSAELFGKQRFLHFEMIKSFVFKPRQHIFGLWLYNETDPTVFNKRGVHFLNTLVIANYACKLNCV